LDKWRFSVDTKSRFMLKYLISSSRLLISVRNYGVFLRWPMF